MNNADVERHEERIYQPGYTPRAIRENIQKMLQDSNRNQHMVDFPDKDIPPPERDAQTHRVLTDLLQKRRRLDQDFELDIAAFAADGALLDPTRSYAEAFSRRDAEYNNVNRQMYSVYAASAYIIHDRNFSSYCRPDLRYLPEATAFKLAVLKNRLQPSKTDRLQPSKTDRPPYTTVQQSFSAPTQPVFTASRPSYADVVRSPLKPRAPWMKLDPPFMSDADADRTWHQGNDKLFGEQRQTDDELQAQINKLQQRLEQRRHAAQQMRTSPVASQDFRQERRPNTSDGNPKPTNNQSESQLQQFFRSSESTTRENNFLSSTAVPKYNTSQKRPLVTQSSSSTAVEESQKTPKSGQKTKLNAASSSKKQKGNDFGGDTFWNRPVKQKRGQRQEESKALALHANPPRPHNLIVDTGASHVLFQEKHMGLLTNVQLSRPNNKPFATLTTANGQVLKSIGRGIFRVKTIAVVAYIFKDDELVHNLLGIAPFADCGCHAVFTATDFNLFHGKHLLLTGKRHSANLWHIVLPAQQISPHQHTRTSPRTTTISPALLLHENTRTDRKYVQFIHACMGSPPPSTFLRAVQRGYLSDPNQFPRLTTKMVRRHMPESEATARGHLNKTVTAQPHAQSQSVSARHRAHKNMLRSKSRTDPTSSLPTPITPFDPTTVPKSTTLHFDYTGRLPIRGSMGTLYYLVATWGSYIHFEPLTSLTGKDTADALKKTVLFFRKQGVALDTLRMDNQTSQEIRAMAISLDLTWELVNPYQKEPNRAERAIRTGKNHMLAVRAGFHRDCSASYLDQCMFQVEVTLNLLHPYEYDPAISAHEGVFGKKFDFARHPIAPAGSKVLVWNSPDNRGSWSDHGIPGIYLGPAMKHFRGFNVWVPQTSSRRVSGTVWWFVKPMRPDGELLSPANLQVMYPPSRERVNPVPDGSDLLGRFFLEPSSGICCITRLGPTGTDNEDNLAETLHYRCVKTQGEYYATVTQIETWIKDGPLLQKPMDESIQYPAAPVTYPCYFPQRTDGILSPRSPPNVPSNATIPNLNNLNEASPLPDSDPVRRSQRKRKAPDFLKPSFKGKAYMATDGSHVTRKQRVPVEWVYLGKERVSQPEIKIRRLMQMRDKSASTSQHRDTFLRFRQQQRHRRNQRVGWWDLYPSKEAVELQAMTHTTDTLDVYSQSMPKSTLPHVYPSGPLNLNPDGTTISYKKSHMGPNAAHWAQADAEELERLFKSGTLRPIMHQDIPEGKEATYMNPVCSEKLHDNGALKLRTRATIGGDRIDYPYSTTAVTAELESIKILMNAMISDNAAFSTVDLEDFYLGTSLPHPEYIRIPLKFIPKKVRRFYNLDPFLYKGALYCVVLKTHYGLPQAGALSQNRLFAHLELHGYFQLFHAPALFRNKDGSIRFALVVDDFAVVWSSHAAMSHFLQVLRKLYTIKVDHKGTKYLGITIDIERAQRHVTLSMPGYIAKLLKRVRPQGIKSASTPSLYSPPNYKTAGAQTATVDDSPLATKEQQLELQIVVGTLLYYARTVDPSILTVVHELGSVQSKPTLNDLKKMERLLQYISSHQNQGIRFHASTMQLQIQSDASYLCRPKARSVLGGLHYLGTTDQINGPFFCTSKKISCVVSSAAEAELGAAFQNAQKGAQFRNTLIELGYPQEPTTLLVDNTVAEGLASNTVNARRSKSMDVRFFWLRDRVHKAQFIIRHLAGRWNISDFFTKPLPKDKFEQFAPYIIVEVEPKDSKPKTKTVVMLKTV
jgi:hypothetical protein